MASLMSQLGVDRLSIEDRVRLINEVSESLEAEIPPQPSVDLREELDRRLAEYRANPEPGCTLDEIESQFRARLRSCGGK